MVPIVELQLRNGVDQKIHRNGHSLPGETVSPEKPVVSDYKALYPVVEALFTHPEKDVAYVGRWKFPDQSGNDTYVMPGETPDVKGIKVIQSHPDNKEKGLPRSTSTITLFSKETGIPFAIMDATELTPAKSALESAVALRAWENAQQPQTVRLGIIGGGPNARSHFEAFRQLSIKGIEETTIYSPRDSGRLLVRKLASDYQDDSIYHSGSIEEIFERSNVIVCATTAQEPFVTPWHIQQGKGKLVIGLGFHDVSEKALQSAQMVIYDDPEQYRLQDLEAGRYLHSSPPNVTTLSGVACGERPISTSGSIIFVPFGLGTIDIALAHQIYKEGKSGHHS
ncbi:MAG: ornithine cyclodeaminase family protein [Candidatus Levybacteria bacterium]|nr:ornithine cyclodeaminase family protein [Candidatus Levybacteria bacterium]